MAIVARYLIDTSAAARMRHPAVAERLAPLIEAGLVATTAQLDAAGRPRCGKRQGFSRPLPPGDRSVLPPDAGHRQWSSRPAGKQIARSSLHGITQPGLPGDLVGRPDPASAETDA